MRVSQREKPPLAESLATEANEGQSFQENIDKKIERYSRARKRATDIISHVELEFQKTQSPGLAKIRDGLIECGNYLHFRHYPTKSQTRLFNANFCKKHLFCPLCAIRRASKSLSSYLERYKTVLEQNPNLKPYMVTYTVKNGDDLSERYEHLTKSLSKLVQNRRRSLTSKNSRHATEWKKIKGAVGSFEFTNKNKGKGWHPHVHIIALVEDGEMLDEATLQSEWLKITGDSHVVDVREIYDKNDPDNENPISGFVEVFKYALKFSDLSYQQQIHAALTLSKRRLLFSLGLFRGVKVPESLLDEKIEDLPYVDLLYRYIDGQYRLKEVID